MKYVFDFSIIRTVPIGRYNASKGVNSIVNLFTYILSGTFSKKLCALLLVMALSLSLASCGLFSFGDNESSDNPSISGNPQYSPIPQDEVRPPEVAHTPTPEETGAPTPEIVTDSPAPQVAPPEVPLREAADDSFFEDAAFMGNSLMNGFEMFSGLTTPDYYTATSMSVLGATSVYCVTLDNGGAGTMVDGLIQKPYGKIYILLGINEIGLDVEYFIDQYSAMLDTIIAAQPECDIYILGLTPVSQAKSSSSSSFNMSRIETYNNALYELAAEKNCYYLDMVSALADETGYLPANETTDGIHFSAGLYSVWADFIRTHYVGDLPLPEPETDTAPETDTTL